MYDGSDHQLAQQCCPILHHANRFLQNPKAPQMVLIIIASPSLPPRPEVGLEPILTNGMVLLRRPAKGWVLWSYPLLTTSQTFGGRGSGCHC